MVALAELIDPQSLLAAPLGLRALLAAVNVPDRARDRFRTRFTALGGWGFSRTETTGHIALRWRGTPADAAAYHWLILSSSGSAQGASPPLVGTRNAALVGGTLLSPSLGLSGTGRHVIVHVPAHAIPSALADGVPFESERGSGAVLAAMVRAIEREAASIHHNMIEPTLAALTVLIEGAVTARDDAAPPLHRIAARDRIADHLEMHFDDPGLTAYAVAQACGLSLRQLHRMLEGSGESFGAMLRRVRLAHALELLSQGHTISDTAEAAGFTSASYFATAFRARFGCAPSVWRRD